MIHAGSRRYMLVVEGTDLRRVMATEGGSWFKKGQHDFDRVTDFMLTNTTVHVAAITLRQQVRCR
jgi:hypothetical protein